LFFCKSSRQPADADTDEAIKRIAATQYTHFLISYPPVSDMSQMATGFRGHQKLAIALFAVETAVGAATIAIVSQRDLCRASSGNCENR
jgi:hypothetical protein